MRCDPPTAQSTAQFRTYALARSLGPIVSRLLRLYCVGKTSRFAQHSRQSSHHAEDFLLNAPAVGIKRGLGEGRVLQSRDTSPAKPWTQRARRPAPLLARRGAHGPAAARVRRGTASATARRSTETISSARRETTGRVISGCRRGPLEPPIWVPTHDADRAALYADVPEACVHPRSCAGCHPGEGHRCAGRNPVFLGSAPGAVASLPVFLPPLQLV